jgi:hypothetical protein
MSFGIDAIQKSRLREGLLNPEVARTVLGIESINGGLIRRNHLAAGLAEEFHLASVGSSDGHNIDAIGRVVTQFEGSSIRDLKTALIHQKTAPMWRGRDSDLIYVAKHLTYSSLRKMGYAVGLDAHHRSPKLYPVEQLKK